MNKKLLMVFVIFFIAVGISGLFGWVFYKPPRSNHRVVLFDSSISSTDDRCAEVVKLTEIAIKKPATNDKTKIAVFLTGDPQTANEPRGLDSYDVPFQLKLTQGNLALETQKKKMLDVIKAKCEQLLPAQNSSIFLGFKRSVEHLRSLGCDDKSKCEVLAQTDLQENADQQIKTAIAGTSASPKKLPTAIDNQGVAIEICGISQTRGIVVNQKGQKSQVTQNRNTTRADLIQDVWKKLFTHSELITFAPYCSE